MTLVLSTVDLDALENATASTCRTAKGCYQEEERSLGARAKRTFEWLKEQPGATTRMREVMWESRQDGLRRAAGSFSFCHETQPNG